MAAAREPSVAMLEAALTDLADAIAYPPADDLSRVVVARLQAAPAPTRRRSMPSRAVAFAIAVVLVVVALLALPAPREAIADWLGIGRDRIVRVNDVPAGLGTTLHLGRESTLAAARRSTPFAVLVPATLDEPGHVFVDEPSPGSVTLLWAAGGALPPVRDLGLGMLLTEIPGSIDEAILQKRLPEGTTLESTTVGGVAAYWIGGPRHELMYLDPHGEPRPDTTRLAANTLIWAVDGVTFRLESALDKAAAVAIASHLKPAG